MLHTIQNTFLTVSAEEHGAQLRSIRSTDGTEYLWQGDDRYWNDRAPNLFPYVGRLKEGHYFVDGQSYQMPIHGLAPYQDFRMTSCDGTQMVFELAADDETLAKYPRQFVFRVIYRLSESTLHICYEVENRDEKPMFFGLGGHPGFNIPMVPGKRFEDYRLRFGQQADCREVILTPDCFITDETRPFPLENGTTLPLRHSLFDNDAIVLTDMARSITLETEGDEHGVTVTYPQMPYLGLWHRPHTDAPYVCIEPWCSLPSGTTVTVLESKQDLLRLEPGTSYQNHWTIEIHGA